MLLDNLVVQARENNIPIMQAASLAYLKKIITEEKVKTILEIGTGIGYSTINMALEDDNIKIISVERDQKRYQMACDNVTKIGLEDRVQLILGDAKEVSLAEKFDLILIDAAKSSNKIFFEHFAKNLNPNGLIVTDNVNFYGLLNEKITNRNLKQLVNKIKKYRIFLEEKKDFTTTFVDVGDGLSISKRSDE